MSKTFGAKQALKYMLDDKYVIQVGTKPHELVYFLGVDLSVIDSINIDHMSITDFLQKFSDETIFKFKTVGQE